MLDPDYPVEHDREFGLSVLDAQDERLFFEWSGRGVRPDESDESDTASNPTASHVCQEAGRKISYALWL